MTEQQNQHHDSDGVADAVAAIAVITIIIAAAVFWLSGMH